MRIAERKMSMCQVHNGLLGIMSGSVARSFLWLSFRRFLFKLGDAQALSDLKSLIGALVADEQTLLIRLLSCRPFFSI
jgi:hypothetical protein